MKRLFALAAYLRLLIYPSQPPVGNTDDRVLNWLTEDYEIN